MQARIRKQARTHPHTGRDTHTHTQAGRQAVTHRQAGTHTQRGRQAHTGAHTCIDTCRRAHIQACTHTGTHTYWQHTQAIMACLVLDKGRANGDSLCMRGWATKGTPTVQ
uniref:Uncharacterized protein n=1 Tax=Dunaliella tertiolecta TaxID=3047 RepID=A0A7S3R3L9_DUNTE